MSRAVQVANRSGMRDSGVRSPPVARGSIYLNNAATSFPKPRTVLEAVSKCLAAVPREPGRAGQGEDPVWSCRQRLANLFGVADPRRICIAPSATHALNLVIAGLLGRQTGGHAVTTCLEHNSVLRPLAHLSRESDLAVHHISPDADGRIAPGQVAAAIRRDTRLVAIGHASNVTGAIQPIAEIADVAARLGSALLIDAAQTAGAVPLNHAELSGRVFIAFAGHKGLYGPTGVGGLVLPDADIAQTVVGGTGIRSEAPLHPPELPLRLEAGTPNLPGVAGLTAGVDFVLRRSVERLGAHRDRLVRYLRDQLCGLREIRLLPLPSEDGRAGVVSFLHRKFSPSELSFLLRETFGIELRSGLHCAPMAHEVLGTAPHGTLRVSVGNFNRTEELDVLVEALKGLEGT